MSEQIEKLKQKRLLPKQDKFCYYYAVNSETFGNITQSYILAYNIKLEGLSTETPKDAEGKVIGISDYDKAINACAVSGRNLLRQPHVDATITKLLNESLNDQIVDRELSKIIQGNEKGSTKVSAIHEYNLVKSRITNKQDITSAGFPILQISEEVAKKNGLNGIAP